MHQLWRPWSNNLRMYKMNSIGGSLMFYINSTFSHCFILVSYFSFILFFVGCQIVTQFKEQGLNTELYYKNKEMGETFSIVPTSAIRHKPVDLLGSSAAKRLVLLFWYIFLVCGYYSGESIPDLLLLLVQWTQKTMVEKLTYTNEIFTHWTFIWEL